MHFIALASSLALAPAAFGQVSQQGTSRAATRNAEPQAPPADIDAQTGRILNEAIELMNAEDYAGAAQKIGTLELDRLSPYERGTVERVLFNTSYAQERYEEARTHLQRAIDSGGLNAQQISEARYQSAQLFVQEGEWPEAAAALEAWFETEPSPNSAAYYLLAAAYFQQGNLERALPPAKRAVELMDPAKPNESWLNMLSAVYLQSERYQEAIPVLQRLVAAAPDKKAYWLQLSSVYVQEDDYANGLAALQLAYAAGLVRGDADVRRLADLLVFNGVPYRGARVLEAAIEDEIVTLDDKLYEKLANCWIAAGELDKSLAPLRRAAELSPSGDLFVRLGEVHVQLQDWDGVIAAVARGIDKGALADPGNADLMLGIAHYSRKSYADAVPFFERARRFDKHRSMADSYLQAIRAEN
jgi:tetratricopeptide (TPR) repeat protein